MTMEGSHHGGDCEKAPGGKMGRTQSTTELYSSDFSRDGGPLRHRRSSVAEAAHQLGQLFARSQRFQSACAGLFFLVAMFFVVRMNTTTASDAAGVPLRLGV